MVEKWNK